ncbi:alpha/beta-hydrolase [Gymnopilus junonius]|uniref:Alpha/beta-hydrolase n=1 Tax=Gymnopilus junonius TaxID=109634 RepID=A0A9P5NHK9_GYMJU|nr:alpha/beta-hydrolase [Gymnopilus junonius]
MPFVFRTQPLKALYLFFTVFSLLFIQLPFYTIRYAVPSMRPRRSWTLGRSLIIVALQSFINAMYNTTLMTPSDPQKSAAEGEKVGFVSIPAVPSDLVTGEVLDTAKINNVKAVTTGGFWYCPKGQDIKVGQKAEKDEKVIYHFHGGGFTGGTGNPSNANTKAVADGFLQHIPSNPRLFALEYRVSSAPPFGYSNPFPAALLDALAGYRYLVQDLGFEPQNIIVSGDSAGGLLAFWLARYLSIGNLPNLPIPGAMLLLSPTVDWANTQMGPSSSMKRNSSSDFVYPILASGHTLRALLGNLPEADAAQNSWVAPGSVELKYTPGLFGGLPKTYILAGGAEQTLDAMVILRERLEKDLGKSNVVYLEQPDATHDFLALSFHEPERTEALGDIARWVKDEVWSHS